MSGWMTMMPGHSAFARPVGIADRTPLRRAS